MPIRAGVTVAHVSQQQWGGPAPYGRVPGRPPATQPGWGQSPYGQGYPGQGYPGQGYPGQGFAPPSFGPGPPFGAPPGGGPPYGMGRPPAPRRRNPLASLLRALIGVALVVIVGFMLVGTQSTPSEVAYQNDNYKVPPPDRTPPPIPVPETYREAERIVTDSPFYGQTAPAPVRCTSSPINVDSASDAQLESHFEGIMECLVRVWQPPVTQAGLEIARPSVTIYGAKMTTKCGTSGVNAFYCAADQQIYYSNRLAGAVPVVKTDKWAADVVMAHEFGHALQARTGILISAKALGQESGDEATDLLYSRRLETQADCFSGMFIRSVSVSLGVRQQDVAGIEDTYRAIGDDTLSRDPSVVGNHGLSRSRLFWGKTGLENGAIASCNTFTAPTSQVR